MQMMILCDCVAQDQPVVNKSELFKFIADLSEIIEVRAIAMKDLHDALTKPQCNNLYLAWVSVTDTDKTK